nr:hypothetical protein [Mesorhizobium sp. M4A.F.Ca.ET.022.05.2.1]
MRWISISADDIVDRKRQLEADFPLKRFIQVLAVDSGMCRSSPPQSFLVGCSARPHCPLPPVAAFVGGKRVSLNIASRHGSVEITCETADNGKQRLAKNE